MFMFNDCEPRKKINGWTILVIIFSIIFVLSIGLMIGIAVTEHKQYNEWYNGLSAEERAEVDAQKQAKYDANVFKYEVLNISKYVKTKTNGFGGIISTEIRYQFSYIDDNGQLKHVDSFPSSLVKIGDNNEFVYNKNNGGGQSLVLTKETLNNIQSLNGGI